MKPLIQNYPHEYCQLAKAGKTSGGSVVISAPPPVQNIRIWLIHPQSFLVVNLFHKQINAYHKLSNTITMAQFGKNTLGSSKYLCRISYYEKCALYHSSFIHLGTGLPLEEGMGPLLAKLRDEVELSSPDAVADGCCLLFCVVIDFNIFSIAVGATFNLKRSKMILKIEIKFTFFNSIASLTH